MQWVTEVEMVDSVDDLNLRHLLGVSMPNFDVLDARIDCFSPEQDHP